MKETTVKTTEAIPFDPSPRTRFQELPSDVRDAIRNYVQLLFRAKAAGVAGEAIKSPSRYVDEVVGQRARECLKGPDETATVLRQMEGEMANWEVRMHDHAERGRRASDRQNTAEVIRIRQQAQTMEPALAARLAKEFYGALDRDHDRVRELMPRIQQPDYASLTGRALDVVRGHPAFAKFRQFAGELPPGAYHAAAARFAHADLSVHEFAMLYGSWAKVVEEDHHLLEIAFSNEADEARQDFESIHEYAWVDPIDIM